MFEKLQERLESTFKKLRGYGKLSEDNIKDALREVRVALLEADVNYKVAKDFLEKVKEKAMGEDVVTSITPGQQFIKIVYDELCTLLGSTNKPLDVAGSPPVAVLLVGLQGSGKTTTCGKLALHLRKKGPQALTCAYGRLQARRNRPACEGRQADQRARLYHGGYERPPCHLQRGQSLRNEEQL